jgi:hypothetical protein
VKQSSQINLARQLLERLERLSADSRPAHKASGLRGSLLKYLAEYDRLKQIDDHQEDLEKLEEMIQRGYALIEQAARLM